MPNTTKTFDPTAIDERNETLQFIGNPPTWFMRFGISVICLVLVVFTAGAYFIKYPDIVTAKVTITTSNPPIRVLAKSSARVTELLVKNNAIVKQGEVLCVMENAANWKHVLALEKQLNYVRGTFKVPRTLESKLESGLKLGALQSLYSTYAQNLKDYHYFSTKNGVAAKIEFLKQQIENTQQLNTSLEKQKQIQAKELVIAARDFARQKQLHSDGIISDQDYEKADAQLMVQYRTIAANEAAFINNNISVVGYQNQINDLLQGKNDNTNAKQLTLNEDARRLKSGIEEWKQTNLIIAPVAGKVNFSKIWSAQQTIASGEEVLAVVPSDTSQLICKAVLPVAQSGKVKVGLLARISIDAYPYQQFGVLKSRVENISLVPQKEDYLLDIALLNGLTSTYKKLFPLRQEMSGTANIITEDRSVLGRIFDKFKDLERNR